MKKKRAKSDPPIFLNSAADDEAVEPQTTVSEGKSFFACYLLVSLSPRFKTHTYIGFTVNPRRRIRQHNGEIGCGAWRTKKRRPWEMVLCIHGFPTHVAALQFEWAWQHPVKSLAVRKAAANFKSLSGIANKIKLAYTMLTLPSWQSMDITVSFFSTKYMKHCAGCPGLPERMKVQICSMDELPCYTERFDDLSDDDDCIDREEQENNDSVPDGLYDPVASEGDTNGECGWNRGYEVTEEPCHSVTLGDQSGLSGSINLQLKQSLESVGGSDRKEQLIEEKDVISCENTGSAEFFQAECKQPGIIVSVDSNQEFSSVFILPLEAELIDLSSPFPTCQSFSGRKKRRISNASNFIDLTISQDSVQL